MAGPSIGMMTYSFHRQFQDGALDVPGFVRLCAKLGVEALDITERHWTRGDEEIAETAAALQETGLTVASCNTSIDLVTPGAAARGEREAAARKLLDRLAVVKCPRVMLGSPTHDLSPAEWRSAFGRGLAQCLDIADEYGVTITFENRGGPAGQFVGVVEHVREILDAADDERLKFTFDVGNFRYVSADWNAAFDELADVIAHVHLKDVAPKGDSFGMMPLGEGEVDNAPIIRKLAARGYAGCLAIECGGRGCDEEDARKSVAFVRRALAG